MNTKLFINTERLTIRLAETEDAISIFSYRSDFIENKYQGWFPNSVEEVCEYISNMPRTMNIANTYIQFAIILKEENKLIGDLGINFTNYENMQTEIGCTLHKNHKKKRVCYRSVESNGRLPFRNSQTNTGLLLRLNLEIQLLSS